MSDFGNWGEASELPREATEFTLSNGFDDVQAAGAGIAALVNAPHAHMQLAALFGVFGKADRAAHTAYVNPRHVISACIGMLEDPQTKLQPTGLPDERAQFQSFIVRTRGLINSEQEMTRGELEYFREFAHIMNLIHFQHPSWGAWNSTRRMEFDSQVLEMVKVIHTANDGFTHETVGDVIYYATEYFKGNAIGATNA